VPLDDVDPDDAFSSIPYEKGYIFLYYLQELVGGPSVFEPFIKEHCKKYGIVLQACTFIQIFVL
jgi:leukotriene-A4 hydrolase